MTASRLWPGVGAVAAAVTHPELGPLWYPIAIVVTAWPCVWIGARWAQ